MAEDGAVKKAFPFGDPVGAYTGIKEGSGDVKEVAAYIGDAEAEVSDRQLLGLLSSAGADCRMMGEAALEESRSKKQAMMVEAGLASDERDALARLREFAIGLSSARVGRASSDPAMHVIQAVGALDEADRSSNTLGARMREWYGLHFPELDNVVDSVQAYAGVVLAGRRGGLTREAFEGAGLGPKAEMLGVLASKSRGGEISDADLGMAQEIAGMVIKAREIREKLEARIAEGMAEVAPNLTAILGPQVGARILARAGSLTRLASFPASTIQVIGAERALFRSVKTGSDPPKHGLLFQHAAVHAAPRWQRGKIARAVAAKAAVAARVDVYGDGLNRTLLEKLNVRISEISSRYADPPEPRGGDRAGGRGRDGGRRGDDRGGGYREGGRRRDDRGGYRGGRRDDRDGSYRGRRRDDRGGDRGGRGDYRGGRRRDDRGGDRGGDRRGGRRDDRGRRNPGYSNKKKGRRLARR